MFEEDAILEISMRDFIASLLRMVNLKNDYFVDQFNSEVERKDVILDLLSPGTGCSKEDSRGGILRNFNIKNINAELANDNDL